MPLPSALTPIELALALASLPGWELVPLSPSANDGADGQALHKTLRFDSFQAAMAFLPTLVAPLDALNHHPVLVSEWRDVGVSFTTWDLGRRLTALDIQAASIVERLYQAAEGTWSGVAASSGAP